MKLREICDECLEEVDNYIVLLQYVDGKMKSSATICPKCLLELAPGLKKRFELRGEKDE